MAVSFSLARAFVDILPRDAKTILALDTLRGKLQSLVNRFGDASRQIGKSLTLIGGAMTTASAFIAKFAIDAVENANLFIVSMGNMADAAQEWVEDYSEAMRTSEDTTKRQLGIFSAFFQGLGIGSEDAFEMSKAMVALANDMASFLNLPIEKAFLKLQSGLAGEIEPLRRVGVSVASVNVEQEAMRQGILTAARDMDEVTKVYFRYNAILQQTALMQGDLARTIEDPANQLRALAARSRDLAIALGESLIPVIQRTLAVILPLVERTIEWIAVNQAFVQTWLPVVSAVGLFAAVLGPIMFVLPNIVSSLVLLAAAATALASPIGLVVAGLTALGGGFAFDALKTSLAEVKEEFDEKLKLPEMALPSFEFEKMTPPKIDPLKLEVDTSEIDALANKYPRGVYDMLGGPKGWIPEVDLAQIEAAEEKGAEFAQNFEANMAAAEKSGADFFASFDSAQAATVEEGLKQWGNYEAGAFEAFTGAKAKAAESFEGLKTEFKETTDFLDLTWKEALELMVTHLSDFLGGIALIIADTFTMIFAKIQDQVDAWLDRLSALIFDFFESTFFKSLVDSAARLFQPLTDLLYGPSIGPLLRPGGGGQPFTGLPEFANGGVVPGSAGSAILARVHAGETIRNPRQEAALRQGGGGVSIGSINITVSGAVGDGAGVGRRIVDDFVTDLERRGLGSPGAQFGRVAGA
jgi:hypothetical protein